MKGLLQIFLTDFHSGSHVEKIQKIKSLIDLGSVDVIVQLVELDSDFRNFCASPTFNEKWISLWSTYGVIITKDIKKALYDQRVNLKKIILPVKLATYKKLSDVTPSTHASDIIHIYIVKLMIINMSTAMNYFAK
jgi:hypothetical protein